MTSKDYISKCKESRTEHEEQVEVARYCKKNEIPMFAIPNGANKSRTAQRMFKAEGLKAGVPDLMIPIHNSEYGGLFIEMKRRAKTLKSGKKSISHTKVSKEQQKWLDDLLNNGYYTAICYGSDEAIEVIKNYMEFD